MGKKHVRYISRYLDKILYGPEFNCVEIDGEHNSILLLNDKGEPFSDNIWVIDHMSDGDDFFPVVFGGYLITEDDHDALFNGMFCWGKNRYSYLDRLNKAMLLDKAGSADFEDFRDYYDYDFKNLSLEEMYIYAINFLYEGDLEIICRKIISDLSQTPGLNINEIIDQFEMDYAVEYYEFPEDVPLVEQQISEMFAEYKKIPTTPKEDILRRLAQDIWVTEEEWIQWASDKLNITKYIRLNAIRRCCAESVIAVQRHRKTNELLLRTNHYMDNERSLGVVAYTGKDFGILKDGSVYIVTKLKPPHIEVMNINGKKRTYDMYSPYKPKYPKYPLITGKWSVVLDPSDILKTELCCYRKEGKIKYVGKTTDDLINGNIYDVIDHISGDILINRRIKHGYLSIFVINERGSKHRIWLEGGAEREEWYIVEDWYGHLRKDGYLLSEDEVNDDGYEQASKPAFQEIKQSSAGKLYTSKTSYQEIKQFLECSLDQYYISQALFWDLTGGRTRVIFDLKNVRYRMFLQKLHRNSLSNEPSCEHTFRELFELLVNYNKNYPDGKVSFSESEMGIRIMFDTKGLNQNIQSNNYKTHTIDEARELPEQTQGRFVGNKTVYYDKSLGRTRIIIQLDNNRLWFLQIFFDNTTEALLKYDLDYEGTYESHFEFKNEDAIRKKIYQPGDEEKYLEDLFIRFIEEHSGDELQALVKPYTTAQYYYD